MISANYPFKNFLTLFLCLIIFYAFWYTNFYNILVLRIATFGTTNSLLMPLWMDLRKQMNVYVFNYTNIDNFMSGNESIIKIDEIGPYVYKDEAKKVNLKEFGNFITFQENVTLTFSPSRSGNLNDTDKIISPNLAFLSSIPDVTEMGSFAEFGLSTMVRFLKIKQFEEVEVKKFLFGYQNDFIDIALKFKKNFTPEMVGVLTRRTGVQNWNVTFDPSEFDPLRVNSVGKKFKMNAWKSENCNKIHGSDGFYVNAEDVWNKKDLFAFLPFLCLTFQSNFVGEGQFNYLNLRSFVYELPQDIYSHSSPNYCEAKSSQQSCHDGLLDMSSCLNVPIFISHPHFLYGDPKLSELFDGLNPIKEKHLSSFHMHPRVGAPFGGFFRFQFNIKVSHFRENFKSFPDDMVLPIAWIDLKTETKEWLWFEVFCGLSKFIDFVEILGKYGSIFGVFYSCWKVLSNFITQTDYESVKMSEIK